MKTPLLITTLLTATLMAGASYADDDCQDPVADWQPKQVLRQKLEADGWQVHRIKVDDGCYEVKGLDQNGDRVKAEYFPASLKIRSLKIKYDDENAVAGDAKRGNEKMKQKKHDMQEKRNLNNANDGE